MPKNSLEFFGIQDSNLDLSIARACTFTPLPYG
ncbi:Uncharacterised protein [Enterobacter cancerogenus]|uniref:Uncharacterized protein n=1 Tax=Enterobacter cancerogenus TaxID=69218 RepID=A0A484YXQ7_9ENTR|nr:Uncharacterised protein [Enterobacter cancerogenus]